eukprot:NODE_267_length_12253_cov_0.255718.p6 type:complete len:222 gc:universal NODE_267_length_12253_cov_0.255718:7559-8224(+)
MNLRLLYLLLDEPKLTRDFLMSQLSPESPKESKDFVQQCRNEEKLIGLGIHTLNDIEITRVYLAAHENVMKAKNELVDLLNWRASIKYDQILASVFPEYCNTILYLYEVTENGTPVVFYKVKNHLPLVDDLDIMIQQAICFMGNIQRKYNYPKVILCIDKEGATKDNINLTLAKQFVTIFTKYFPETLAELLIFQSNFALWSFWSIIKPFMDPDTVKKVFP